MKRSLLEGCHWVANSTLEVINLGFNTKGQAFLSLIFLGGSKGLVPYSSLHKKFPTRISEGWTWNISETFRSLSYSNFKLLVPYLAVYPISPPPFGRSVTDPRHSQIPSKTLSHCLRVLTYLINISSNMMPSTSTTLTNQVIQLFKPKVERVGCINEFKILPTDAKVPTCKQIYAQRASV